VQSAALKGLVELEPDPAKLVPILAGVLCQGDKQLVDEAFAAVAAMGDAATPALVEALKNPGACLRATALLAQLGPKAAAAAPALSAALTDPNPEVRREALFALASMGPEAVGQQAAIVKALDDNETHVRAIAAYALGCIGQDAQGAMPKLRTELQSSDPVVRVTAAWALVHVSPNVEQVASEVLPVLTQGLKNPILAVRRGSAEGLGRLGKRARGAEGALKVAAGDQDETVRKAALAALEQLGAVLDSPVRPQASPIQKR
jgi:HEAT repeat protein